MKLTTTAFENGSAIPADYTFCKPADPVTFSANKNPSLQWSNVPEGTKSFALIVHDKTVPTKPDDVNQEGREVPADLPRADFFHCVLVDIAPSVTAIEEGILSRGITEHGKKASSPIGRAGLNDYTGWFTGDPSMEGKYFGYDGPCPPWNDSLVHTYIFTLFALDIATCSVEGEFTGSDARQAMEGHILDSATFEGTYTLNKRLIEG